MRNNTSAHQLLDLLRIRHHGDLFVAECKDGPTWGTEHVRMDAWVMKKSWRNPLATAYEIKVSRSDFVNDTKWHQYLPYCHQFYFVAPSANVVDKSELPAEVGLIVASQNLTRLYTKKKAAYRDVQLPDSLLLYLLICRARIDREGHQETDAEFWQGWLADKKKNLDLGYRVSKSLRQLIEKQVTEVVSHQRDLEERCENLEEVRLFVAELGIDTTDGWGMARQAKRRLRDLVAGTTPELMSDIGDGIRTLTRLKETLDTAMAGEDAARRITGKEP